MTMPETDSVLEENRDHLPVCQATHASVLVDYANYYRALHQAIANARHSIFILGWDIDSRIRLLRGEDVKHTNLPIRVYDLIEWKAKENPNLKIYLNRWDFSFFMLADREGFARGKWKRAPSNVKFCMDNAVPTGGCHHQKIVIIDDQIAFCGGMDVALKRWDHRSHSPRDRNRIDPGGTHEPNTVHSFGPYHDIMMLVAGPAVKPLAQIARDRWRRATCEDAIPIRDVAPLRPTLPAAWPRCVPVDFQDVQMAVALTMPPVQDAMPLRQIEKLHFDLIRRAEKFIYMENQYFAHDEIAKALNARMQEVPDLRLLLVSSREPEGIMERKALWVGRRRFRQILESNGMADRFVMAYPLSRESGKEKSVRIHSKLTIVDDRYLRIGSANINKRSMSLDTECDLILEAHDETTRRRIAAIRNDLIREHTGRELEDIENLIHSGANPEKFLNYISHSRQHLCKINDERYKMEPFSGIASRLADPSKPYLPKGILWH